MLIDAAAPKVFGLSDSSQALLGELYREWAARVPRNELRRQYRDSKQTHKHLGIAVPPALQDLEVAVGLPDKAVEGLASRCNWDGVVSPNGSEDPFELGEILDQNRFDVEFPQSVRSAMTYSTSFMSSTLGVASLGEPTVKIMHHSALWSAGLWDRVRRQMRGFLSINDVDAQGRPTSLTMVDPFQIVVCRKGASGMWYIEDTVNHGLRRVPVEPLPLEPSLDRPFGVSRINRRVMNLTDRAVRTILRLEVHSELFSAPKFLLMGAAESNFIGPDGKQIPLWDWYMTRFNAITKGDEDAEMPTLEEISQQSPQPHIESLRAIYSQFAGETNVPLNSLGIVQDNPASAEALYAMKEDLVIQATNFNRVATHALNRVMQNAVMLRDGLDAPTDELRKLSQRFRNAAMPSVVTQSDAMVKQIAAMPWLAESTVALEELGYTAEQIERMQGERRRARLDAEVSALVSEFDAAPVETGL